VAHSIVLPSYSTRDAKPAPVAEQTDVNRGAFPMETASPEGCEIPAGMRRDTASGERECSVCETLVRTWVFYP